MFFILKHFYYSLIMTNKNSQETKFLYFSIQHKKNTTKQKIHGVFLWCTFLWCKIFLNQSMVYLALPHFIKVSLQVQDGVFSKMASFLVDLNASTVTFFTSSMGYSMINSGVSNTALSSVFNCAAVVAFCFLFEIFRIKFRIE